MRATHLPRGITEVMGIVRHESKACATRAFSGEVFDVGLDGDNIAHAVALPVEGCSAREFPLGRVERDRI